ncbi:MAG: ATP-binding protein [Patescibacteria group bacterium]
MINLNTKSIVGDLFTLNPWWGSDNLLFTKKYSFYRDLFDEFLDRVVNRDLITSLVGLRRVGKSTMIQQTIYKLIENGVNPKSILYFLFEDITAKNVDLSDYLRKIIDYQINQNPKEKIYIFLDEIQYINGWNSVLKRYFDIYPQIKFIVSGSSSLFINTESKESLAGRIQELILRPMSYGEYLRMTDKDNTEMHFMEYLSWGEFPYLEKLINWEEKKEYINDFVFKKVVENDLPKYRKIYGSEIVNMLNILMAYSGQTIEIQNFASDLGIAQNTTREYLSLLEKTHLISQVFNMGIGFRTRSVRQRKIYLTSVNASVLHNYQGLMSESWQRNIGNIIETFVYNHLVRKNQGEVSFWRQRQIKEVDFINLLTESKLPIEVKYQNEIKKQDLENLLYYCKKEKLNKAVIITKNEDATREIEGVKIEFKSARNLLN